jgi:hypothetical protein
MGETYLSDGLAGTARKRKILELIYQGPQRGVVLVILHSDFGGDFENTDLLWVYDYRSNPQQVETVIEMVDRHIAGAFTSSRYHSATVKVIDPGRAGFRKGEQRDKSGLT